MTAGVFVTGTDTGVGKTTVACALIHALASRGIDAMPMKPVAAGAVVHEGGWANADSSPYSVGESLTSTPSRRTDWPARSMTTLPARTTRPGPGAGCARLITTRMRASSSSAPNGLAR